MYAICFCLPCQPWLECQMTVVFNKTALQLVRERMEQNTEGLANFWTVQESGFLKDLKDAKRFHDRCKLLRRTT